MPGAVAVLLLDEVGKGLVGEVRVLFGSEERVGRQGGCLNRTRLPRAAHKGGDVAFPVGAISFDRRHLGQLVQDCFGGAPLGVGGGQRVGHQRQGVGILRITPELAHVIEALLRARLILVASVRQRPDDVGGHRQSLVVQIAPG